MTQGTRITILALGSQGDVQPLIALGSGLQRAGYLVRLATNANFAEFVSGEGLELSLLSGDFRALMAGEHEAFIEQGRNPISMAGAMSRIMKTMMMPWAEEGKAACYDADLIIAGTAASYLGGCLAEALGKPFVQAYLGPGMLFTDLPMGPYHPVVNHLLHHGLMFMFWQSVRSATNGVLRPQLGLRHFPWYGPQYQWRRQHSPVLFGFSPHVIPQPSKWPPHGQITGYWFLNRDQSWQPPTALIDFLKAGSKPIYVGFGSMSNRSAELTTQLVIEALRTSNQRAILATGWGGLGEITRELDANRVFIVNHAPHEWLFPQVSLAVHHGGAGTTAAAIRAGIPSVVIPFFGDQPFWAWRLEQLGIAPPPIPRKSLTAKRLVQAIRFASGEDVRLRATELGKCIRAEDGVAKAIEALHNWNFL